MSHDLRLLAARQHVKEETFFARYAVGYGGQRMIDRLYPGFDLESAAARYYELAHRREYADEPAELTDLGGEG